VLGLEIAIRISAIDRDGDVDPEDRAPRPLREVAAEDRADRGEAAGDAEEERQRAPAFAQRERLHDDRERGGEHDRAARALDHAEGDDPRLGEAALGREPAHRGGGGEDDDAERDHLAVPDGVREASAEREQRREREQVGVDRPLHAGARQRELLAHVRRGDRDDRLVDERHRHREDHRREDQVARLVLASLAAIDDSLDYRR
jgi:hypothetical protein